MSIAATVRMMGSANSHLQDAISTSRAERYIPRMPPPPATAVHIPIARDRSLFGNEEVITDSVTGMISAAPMPLNSRDAIMTSMTGAMAPATFATPKITRPVMSTGLRPRRSPRAPSGRRRAARVSV